MNYFQRKRFMKASWLAHFTHRLPGSVIVDTSRARRRQPGEAVLDVELEAMGLSRADVEPPIQRDEIPPPPSAVEPDPVTIPDPTYIQLSSSALVLGYNPSDG